MGRAKQDALLLFADIPCAVLIFAIGNNAYRCLAMYLEAGSPLI